MTAAIGNPAATQATRTTRRFTSVPPIPVVCDRIVRDFERGVSLASLCIIHERRSKAIQQVLRERLRELEAAMRRAGVYVALAVAGLVGIDAYDAVVLDQGAAVERAFRRCRRGRGRREEDGLVDSASGVELRAEDGAGLVMRRGSVSEFQTFSRGVVA